MVIESLRVAQIDSIGDDEFGRRSAREVADMIQITPAAAPPRKNLSGPPVVCHGIPRRRFYSIANLGWLNPLLIASQAADRRHS